MLELKTPTLSKLIAAMIADLMLTFIKGFGLTTGAFVAVILFKDTVLALLLGDSP